MLGLARLGEVGRFTTYQGTFMEAYEVEIVGTGPLLMNECVARHESLGRWPETDLQAAENKLYRSRQGALFLPRRIVLAAILNAGRTLYPERGWPSRINAIESWPVLATTTADFSGGPWTVQVAEYNGCRWAYPRFEEWSARFTLEVDPVLLAPDVLRRLVVHAGEVGLPQYTPFVVGAFGTFAVKSWVGVEEREDVYV